MRNQFERPDLRGLRLEGQDLSGFDLSNTDFQQCVLRKTSLRSAELAKADLTDVDAAGANFKEANLSAANLSGVNLSNANFFQASLIDANLTGANLYCTIFRKARFGGTVLGDVDLETAFGLDEVEHTAPSSIAVDSIFRSGGNLSKDFLRGLGLPQILIDYIPSLVEANLGFGFHSCFISYSQPDEAFATRLWSALRKQRIRVWYAPEEMQGGKTLFDQIERAISLHDKLLLVLSEKSIRSNWVETEIRKALKHERIIGERKLFPIRLVGMDVIKAWECPDADSGRDLAADIRQYFIPDFSEWLKPAKFSSTFDRLCSDLRSRAPRTPAKGEI